MSRERHQDTFFKVHRTLSTCASEAPYVTDEKGLFQSVCNILVRSELFKLAWFGYAAPNARRIGQPFAWSGDEHDFLQELKHVLSHDDYDDPASVCLRTGDACWIKDLGAHPSVGPMRPAVLRCGYTSVISVPLVSQNNEDAALTLYYDDPEAYNEHIVSVLKEKLPHVQEFCDAISHSAAAFRRA